CSMVGVIMPSFVFAPLLVLLFAITLGWLPAGGWNEGALSYILLPVASLTIGYVAGIARIMRGSMIEGCTPILFVPPRQKACPLHALF
ncbi:hypothetical protein SA508_02850, partial [Aggregatibacter actinomycetemcomitans serotype d str. SA508]